MYNQRKIHLDDLVNDVFIDSIEMFPNDVMIWKMFTGHLRQGRKNGQRYPNEACSYNPGMVSCGFLLFVMISRILF